MWVTLPGVGLEVGGVGGGGGTASLKLGTHCPVRPLVFFDRPLFFRVTDHSIITYKSDPNYFSKLSIQ